MSQRETNTLNFSIIQIVALAVAVFGVIIGLIGAASDSDHFYQVYMFAFLFWLQLALGCLALLLLSNVFDARWSFAIRRLAGAGARTLPLLALLSIPLLVSQEEIFPWAADGVELEDGKEIYLTQGFFALRTILYFAIWIALAFTLTEWSYANDDDPDERRTRRIKSLSIAGIILFFLSATFAAFDWSLSLNYESFSSIYGWLAISQGALAAMAFIILMLALFWNEEPLVRIASPRAVGDIGSLLLVAFLVWVYLSFIQYIVMWSGNIPDKVNWYVQRTTGDWEGFATVMVLFHFIPFLLLLVPGLKRMRGVLAAIAGLILFLRVIEMYWTVMPVFSPDLEIEWWDISLILGFGGFWFALFIWFATRKALVPNDPALDIVLAHPDRQRNTPAGTIVSQPAHK
ncbi:MAG: hypothetical protein GYB66_03405 [Chloroflexi bacterium]|nr:hypothetical protein [Chloroflexota bacterium]